MTAFRPRSISAIASSQPTGTKRPARRTNGPRSRSGSASSSFSAYAFGRMKPRLKTSSRSPRMSVIAASAVVTVRPQVASQSGHVIGVVREVMAISTSLSGRSTSREVTGTRGKAGISAPPAVLRIDPAMRASGWMVVLVGVALLASAAPARAVEELTVPPRLRLVVVEPHPDDESLGAGGLIQQTLAGGGRVHVLFMTNGDGYPEAVEVVTG